MPTSLPTANDLHVDSLLTDFAVAYGQDLRSDFVADRAFTPVRVKKQSDKYPVWSKADFFRSVMMERADGDMSAGSGFRLDTSNSYFSEVYALHTYLTDRQRANSESQLMVEQAKVRYLMQQAKLKRDKVWAATAFITGVWTGVTEQTGKSSTPSTNEFLQWNDSSSTPISDISTQCLAVQAATGRKPNVAVTNPVVFNHLAQHDDFLQRVKYTQTGIVTADLMASVLGLDEIIVGSAVENTAAESATATMARVFGKHFLLLHRTPEMSEDAPTAGANFIWSDFDGVTEDGAAIMQWYDKDRKATKFEAEQAFDPKITATDLGVMMLDATA